MKPDPYKKKKSARYQRQHPEAAKGQAGKKDSAKKEERAAPQPALPASDSDDAGTLDDQEVQAQARERARFSRRPLQDNWRRYDEPSDVSVSSMVAEDFNSLADSLAGVALHYTQLQFDDDTDSAPVTPLASDLLAIPAEKVAALLATLPLWTRLGVERETLMPTATFDRPSPSGPPPPSHQAPTAAPPSSLSSPPTLPAPLSLSGEPLSLGPAADIYRASPSHSSSSLSSAAPAFLSTASLLGQAPPTTTTATTTTATATTTATVAPVSSSASASALSSSAAAAPSAAQPAALATLEDDLDALLGL